MVLLYIILTYYSVEDSPKVLFWQGRGNEIMDNKSVKAVVRIIESSYDTLFVYC